MLHSSQISKSKEDSSKVKTPVNYFLASEVLLGNLRIDHMNQNLKM